MAAIPYDMFWRRTCKIIELLEASAELGEGLPERPVVEAGLPRLATVHYAVYVHRWRVSMWGHWMGIQGEDLEGTWSATCVTRQAGDPAELERATSVLAANVGRVLCDPENKGVTGYWDALEILASTAVSRRDQANQTYEVEAIPVRLKWQELQE